MKLRLYKTQIKGTYKVPGGWAPIGWIAKTYDLSPTLVAARLKKIKEGDMKPSDLLEPVGTIRSPDKSYREKLKILWNTYREWPASLARKAGVNPNTMLKRIKAIELVDLAQGLEILLGPDRRTGPRTETEKAKRKRTMRGNATRRELGLKSRT